jgi:hypothetical protein
MGVWEVLGAAGGVILVGCLAILAGGVLVVLACAAREVFRREGDP